MREILRHRDRSLEVTFGGFNQRYIEIPFIFAACGVGMSGQPETDSPVELCAEPC